MKKRSTKRTDFGRHWPRGEPGPLTMRYPDAWLFKGGYSLTFGGEP
jgi:hypothetical protein